MGRGGRRRQERKRGSARRRFAATEAAYGPVYHRTGAARRQFLFAPGRKRGFRGQSARAGGTPFKRLRSGLGLRALSRPRTARLGRRARMRETVSACRPRRRGSLSGLDKTGGHSDRPVDRDVRAGPGKSSVVGQSEFRLPTRSGQTRDVIKRPLCAHCGHSLTAGQTSEIDPLRVLRRKQLSVANRRRSDIADRSRGRWAESGRIRVGAASKLKGVPVKKLKEVPFVSQGRGRFSEVGCGVAGLMMLLKYHDEWGRPPRYEDLAKKLGADKLPSQKRLRDSDNRGKGVYRCDVERWLSGKSICFKRWARKSRNNPPFNRSVTPVMAEMNKKWCPPWGHWIVCTRVTTRSVDYLDPQYGHRKIRSMRRSEFLKGWYGNAVAILGKGKRTEPKNT